MNLWNLGCPAYNVWFVWKKYDFLVTQEQTLGARGHRAFLEHSPAWNVRELYDSFLLFFFFFFILWKTRFKVKLCFLIIVCLTQFWKELT